MTRLAGMAVMVGLLYAALMASNENVRTVTYQQNLVGWLGFYGVLTVGAGVLIVSGGIDLSIGSVVGLGAVCFGLMLEKDWPPVAAVFSILAGAALIGLFHGLLVTRLRLQPFLVTLCGLFIYRGLARWASQTSVGVGGHGTALKSWLVGGIGAGGRNQVFVLLAVALVVGLVLHCTRHGRYLYVVGANEPAARYAGIRTDRYKIFAYMTCSILAGLGSILYMLDKDTATPTGAGSLLELYAITGAVLGGCSLHGGEGTVPGMLLGAAILPLLRGLCSFYNISSDIEYAVIGFALLAGTIADELLRRRGEGSAKW